MAIVRGLPRFDNRSSFVTWSYRVTTNACLDELRRRGPSPDAGRRAPGGHRADRRLRRRRRRSVDPRRRPRRRCRRSSASRSCCATCAPSTTPRSPRCSDVPPGTVRSRIARGRAAVAGPSDREPGGARRTSDPETMTDFDDDELVSAVLDGEANAEDGAGRRRSGVVGSTRRAAAQCVRRSLAPRRPTRARARRSDHGCHPVGADRPATATSKAATAHAGRDDRRSGPGVRRCRRRMIGVVAPRSHSNSSRAVAASSTLVGSRRSVEQCRSRRRPGRPGGARAPTCPHPRRWTATSARSPRADALVTAVRQADAPFRQQTVNRTGRRSRPEGAVRRRLDRQRRLHPSQRSAVVRERGARRPAGRRGRHDTPTATGPSPSTTRAAG